MTLNNKQADLRAQRHVHLLNVALFMMLLISRPTAIMSDDTFCTDEWTQVVFNDMVAGALKANGSYYGWGNNFFGGIGFGDHNTVQTTPGLVGNATDKWKMISMNYLTTIGLKTDGSVYGWGSNTIRILGNQTGNLYTPVQLPGFNNSAYIASTIVNIFAVKADGTLWGNGDNANGQLQNDPENNIRATDPWQIGSDSDWSSVYHSPGDQHVCALKTNKSLYCWGQNDYYQVGDGTNTDVYDFFMIGSPSDTWISAKLNQQYTIALSTNGSLYGWGRDQYSRFGVSTPGADGNYTTPTQIAKLANGTYVNFKTFWSGFSNGLGVAVDGTLWGWGFNNYTLANQDTSVEFQGDPNQISTDTNWEKVFISQNSNPGMIPGGSGFAFKSDGSVYGWGQNDAGQLGIGSTSAAVGVPTQILPGKSFTTVFAFPNVSGIIDTNGELFISGSNLYSQLGDGSSNNSTTPVSCTDRTVTCSNHMCHPSCDPSCATCTGPSNMNCTSCSNPSYFLSSAGSCVASCPNGTYGDITNHTCVNCDSSCATCSGSAPNQCLTCASSYPIHIGTSCYPQCEGQWYRNQLVCISCDASCNGCVNTSVVCAQCASGYTRESSGLCSKQRMNRLRY